jgi:hypothetical protein
MFQPVVVVNVKEIMYCRFLPINFDRPSVLFVVVGAKIQMGVW